MREQQRNKTVMTTFWQTPEEKAELIELARRIGLDQSKTIRLGLELVRAQAEVNA
jgi:hypothetical protein